MIVLQLTAKEADAIIDAIAFIEAGGGIDGEPAQNWKARDRVQRKLTTARSPQGATA